MPHGAAFSFLRSALFCSSVMALSGLVHTSNILSSYMNNECCPVPEEGPGTEGSEYTTKRIGHRQDPCGGQWQNVLTFRTVCSSGKRVINWSRRGGSMW